MQLMPPHYSLIQQKDVDFSLWIRSGVRPLSDTRPGGNWILTLVRAESPQVLAQAHCFPQPAFLLSANPTRWPQLFAEHPETCH